LIARRAYRAHFQPHISDLQLFASLQSIHVQTFRRDVFSDDAGLQVHGFERFPVDEQYLPISSWTSVRASLKACVSDDWDVR
jgi:hypothetical protein